MTFGNEGEALVILITGKATLEDLREIVTDYPRLRATVALYPATDAALLGWLANLGDPDVSQALASRQPSRPAEPPAPPPAANHEQTYAPDRQLGRGGPNEGSTGDAPRLSADIGAYDSTAHTGSAEKSGRGRRGLIWVIAAAAVALAVAAAVIGFHRPTGPSPATQVVATIPVGKYPCTLIASPDGGAYVVGNSEDGVYYTNFGDSTVTVVGNDRLTAILPVGRGTALGTLAPDGTLYMTSFTDGTVTVINGNQVTATIPVSNGADRPVVAPDGTVYIAGDAVTVINGNQVTATIPVSNGADRPVVAPDGTVYAPNYGDGTVAVINGNQVTATIPVSNGADRPVVAPDGTVYVPNKSAVTVINGTQVTATIPVSDNHGSPVVAPDGTVYVTNVNDSTVTVIKGTQATNIPTTDNPVMLLLAGDGGESSIASTPVVAPDGSVYVTGSDGDKPGTVTVIKGAQVSTLHVGRGPGLPVVAPNGTVYVANADDSTVTVINGAQAIATKPHTPVAASDGTVYVANHDDGTVSVIDGTQLTATVPVGRGPIWPVAAPDGAVYVANYDDGTVSVLR